MTPLKNLLATASVAATLSAAVMAVPNYISYQGKLLRNNGQPQTSQTRVRFRFFRGGDGTTFPSVGTVVYNEVILLTPTAEGIVSHLVGTGTAGSGCAEGTCTLTPDDFGDGTLPLWIEAMVDPDGTLGNSDDDVMLPRTRLGTVGYAYRVESIDNALGGVLRGNLTADVMTGKTGLTLGTGADADMTLKFDRATNPDPTLKWDQAGNRFTFSGDVSMANLTATGFTTGSFSTGSMTTGNLTATSGATLGNGADADITLKFDRATNPDPTLKWDQAGNRFTFSGDVSMGNLTANGFTVNNLAATNFSITGALTAQNGATFGKGLEAPIVLRFDRGVGADPTLTWDSGVGQFAFSDPVYIASLTTDSFSTGTFDVRNFSTQGMIATGGVTLGAGSDTDITLRFDRSGDIDPTLAWNHATNRFAFSQGLEVPGDVFLTDQRGLGWPTSYQRCTDYPACTSSGTVTSRFVFGQRTDMPYGQDNNIFFTAYNFNLATGGKINFNEALFKEQTETSYWDPAKIQYIERNWDYVSPDNSKAFRPFYFALATGGSGAAAFQDKAFFQFRTCDTCQSLSLNRNGTVGIGVFQDQSVYKLYVQNPISTRGPSSQNGIKSLLTLTLDGTDSSSLEYVGSEGVARAASFSDDTVVGSIIGTRGSVTIDGDSIGDRTITGYAAGLQGLCTVSSSGSGTVDSGYCVGGQFKASAPGTGTDVTVPVLAGVLIEGAGNVPASTLVRNEAGVFIQDIGGHGVLNQGSIYIAPQTAVAYPGSRNNVRMAGGNWNNGHIQLNGGHLWWDATNNSFRVKNGAPTSETDGTTMTAVSGSRSQGLLKWGDGSDPAFATGSQVCAASGLACERVKTLKGDDSDCQTAQGQTVFYALCR